MLYAILCYDSEAVVSAWPKEKDDEVMASLGTVTSKIAAQKQLGRASEARKAFTQAISLANTASEAAHIRMHLDQLTSASKPSR